MRRNSRATASASPASDSPRTEPARASSSKPEPARAVAAASEPPPVEGGARTGSSPHPRGKMSKGTQVVIALLTAVVAFLAVTQAQQREADALAGMRQADLVRLLDELGTRIDTLSGERDTLRTEIANLESGVTSQSAAAAAAEDLARTREIQAGVVPVRGPGVVVTVTEQDTPIQAQTLVTLVEELRNSGAEAIEVDGVRYAVNGWIIDGRDGIEVNGQPVENPYRIRAIGDSSAISVALEMPGGVLSLLRANGATTDLRTEESLEITSVASMPELEHATVVSPQE